MNRTNISRARTAARKKAKRFEPFDASRQFPLGLTWFAISVASRREFQATHWLEGRGWFTLTPIREIKRLKDRKQSGKNAPREIIQLPVIGGLIFAGHIGPPNWLNLELCRHIHGPLNCNGVPLPIPAPQVARFQKEATTIKVVKTLASGGRARVVSGPFTGKELDVTKISGKWAEVVQNWFGAAATVKIRVDDLEAA